MKENRQTMSDDEKATLRPFFATKGAWRRHIAAVLEAARLESELLQDSMPESEWTDLAALATAETDTIRSQFGQRTITVLGDDFIRDATILFDWKRRRGKRLYRRYMARAGQGK